MQTEASTTAVGASPYVEKWWPVPSAKIIVITATSTSEPITRPNPARRSRSA
jgi:hypothetical protein